MLLYYITKTHMTARPEALEDVSPMSSRYHGERMPAAAETGRHGNVIPIHRERPGISDVRQPVPPEIRGPIEETRGKLVKVSDLEWREVTGYREPQLVERERPLYPVHVIGSWVRGQLGMVRIISTAPRDVSKIYPDKDTAEMADFADWGD